MFYTYVLRSQKDRRWYTGWTADLRNRFRQHQEQQVQSTKGREPFTLIYYEACLHQGDAMARERYLKSGMGKRYLRNRLKRFLAGAALTGLTIEHQINLVDCPGTATVALERLLAQSQAVGWTIRQVVSFLTRLEAADA